MKKNLLVCTLGLFVAASAAGLGWADQDKQAGAPDDAAKKAMMEAWMKVATPGEAHKMLEPFVGSWDTASTMWEAPGAPAQTSTGTAENSWVLGGRYVQQAFKGTYMGMPFEGIGFTGYDNYKKQYVGTWMDNFGTAVMVSAGSYDAAGKTMTLTADMDDFMTGKRVTMREVVRIVDANKHVFEMYGPDPTGKEFKMMEIVYTRRK